MFEPGELKRLVAKAGGTRIKAPCWDLLKGVNTFSIGFGTYRHIVDDGLDEASILW